MYRHLRSHLRHNLVAYLALALVLGMGTAHAAAAIANGSVTAKKLSKNAVTKPKIKAGAVTGAKIKAGAVTGAKIQDRSVTASDLAVGLLPRGSVFAVNTGSSATPVAPPERTIADTSVTVPRSGTALIQWFAAETFLNCSVGTARIGFYVDGVPVPGSRQFLNASGDATAYQLVATVPLSQGTHEIVAGGECTTGSPTTSQVVTPATWTVQVVPD